MKKIIIILLLICSLFSFTNCTQEPEIQIQYVDRYIEVEVPTSHGTHEGFIWDPYTKEDKIIIICADCGKILGEINKITKEVIVEKEVEKIIYQEIPVEVIKEVIIEKEVIKEIPIEIEKIVEKEVIIETIKEIPTYPNLTFCNGYEDYINFKKGTYVNNLVIGYLGYVPTSWGEYYDHADLYISNGITTVKKNYYTTGLGRVHAKAKGGVSIDGSIVSGTVVDIISDPYELGIKMLIIDVDKSISIRDFIYIK